MAKLTISDIDLRPYGDYLLSRGTKYEKARDQLSALSGLKLSPKQQKDLFEGLKESNVGSETHKLYYLSGLHESLGRYDQALKLIPAGERQLHRARVLLRMGRKQEAQEVASSVLGQKKIDDASTETHVIKELLDYTQPYITASDMKGMKDYLNLLGGAAAAAQDRVAIFHEELDMEFHQGNLTNFTAELKMKRPVYHALYLQRVERYREALDALEAIVAKGKISPEDLLLLSTSFKDHIVLQKPIAQMIEKGQGTPAQRRELMSILASSKTTAVKNLLVWLDSHPQEMDRWSAVYTSKMIPSSPTDLPEKFLNSLKENIPNNDCIRILCASDSLVKKRRFTAEDVRHLKQIYLAQKNLAPLDQRKLSTYHGGFPIRRPHLTREHFENVAATSVSMLMMDLTANELYNLLHRSKSFSELSFYDQAGYYALLALDGPFLTSMLQMDWAPEQQDEALRLLAWYLKRVGRAQSAPVSLLDNLADKLPDLLLGRGEDQKHHPDFATVAPLFTLIFSTHPNPENLKAPMQRFAKAVQQRLGDQAPLLLNNLAHHITRVNPGVVGFLPKMKTDKRFSPNRYNHTSALFLASKMFRRPDIKRLRPSYRSLHISRRMGARQSSSSAFTPLSVLAGRSHVQSWLLRYPSLTQSIRDQYPEHDDRVVSYDLSRLALNKKEAPAKIYKYINAISEPDAEVLIYLLVVQYAYQAPEKEIAETLAKLKALPATYQKLIDRAVYLAKLKNKPKPLFPAEKRVGLVAVEAAGMVEATPRKQAEQRSVQFDALKAAGKLKSAEGQELAKAILWDFVRGDTDYGSSQKNLSIKTLVDCKNFESFVKEVADTLAKEKRSQLDILKAKRRLYSYTFATGKQKHVEYNVEIQKLDPNDSYAARLLVTGALKSGDADAALLCLRALYQHKPEEMMKVMQQSGFQWNIFSKAQISELAQHYMNAVTRLGAGESYHRTIRQSTIRLLKLLSTNAPEMIPDLVAWEAKGTGGALDSHFLTTVMETGGKQLVVDTCSKILLPSKNSVGKADIPLIFLRSKGQAALVKNSRILNGMYSVIQRYGIAKDILRKADSKLEETGLNQLSQRFVLELLANPSRETYDRIKPHTLDKLATAAKRELAIQVETLLASLVGKERLALLIYMDTVDGDDLAEHEIIRLFKLSAAAGDARLVEQSWKFFDRLLEKHQKDNRDMHLMLWWKEDCLRATLMYGRDTRWRTLLGHYSAHVPNSKKSWYDRFPTFLRMCSGVLGLDDVSKQPTRCRELLNVVVHVSRENTENDTLRNASINWTLLAAKHQAKDATAYFYDLAKVRLKASNQKQSLEELRFWVNYLRGDPSSVVPVVNARRDEGKWEIQWSLAGVGVIKNRYPFPANIIRGNAPSGTIKAELTILAGVSEDAMQVVKQFPADGISGVMRMELPPKSRFIGMMMKQADGKAIRWARPVKLDAPGMAVIPLEELIPKSEGMAEIIPAQGPFGTNAVLRFTHPVSSGREPVILTSLPWTPGDKVVASVWVSSHHAGNGSLLLVYQDAAGRHLGEEQLGSRGYMVSPQLRGNGVPQQWSYHRTGDVLRIPPATEQIKLALKPGYRSSGSKARAAYDISGFQWMKPMAKARPKGMTLLGRVSGKITSLAATEDDGGLIAVTQQGAIHHIDLQTGKSELRVNPDPGMKKVAWLKVRKNLVYTISRDKNLRIHDLSNGKRVAKVLLPINNIRAAHADISPDGKWLAFINSSYRAQVAQITGHPVDMKKTSALKKSENDQGLAVQRVAFDRAGDLILSGHSNAWKYHPTDRQMEKLGELAKSGVERYFQYIDRPYHYDSSIWIDTVRKHYVYYKTSSSSSSFIKFIGVEGVNQYPVDHQISAFTLLPKSGAAVYADQFGQLRKFVPPAE